MSLKKIPGKLGRVLKTQVPDHKQQCERILKQVLGDKPVEDVILRSLQNGELEGLNDSLAPGRRKTHRGKRAEEQSLQKLYIGLTGLGFEVDDADNQFRFVSRNRYEVPVRFILCRANYIGGAFRTWKKGARSEELLNQNQEQLTLFDFFANTEKTKHNPLQEKILNVWIIADASSSLSLEEDSLTIHLAIPTAIKRLSGWVARPHLIPYVHSELWTGSLSAPLLPTIELPQPAIISVPTPMVRPRED